MGKVNGVVPVANIAAKSRSVWVAFLVLSACGTAKAADYTPQQSSSALTGAQTKGKEAQAKQKEYRAARVVVVKFFLTAVKEQKRLLALGNIDAAEAKTLASLTKLIDAKGKSATAAATTGTANSNAAKTLIRTGANAWNANNQAGWNLAKAAADSALQKNTTAVTQFADAIAKNNQTVGLTEAYLVVLRDFAKD